MSDPKSIPPIALPAGSIDFGALRTGLSGIEGTAEDKRGDRIDSIVGKALQPVEGTPEQVVSGMRADQKIVEVEREDLGITEKVRVYDAKSPEAKAEVAEVAETEPVTEPGRAGNKAPRE